MKFINLFPLMFFVAAHTCQGQDGPLVKSVSDVYKLKENECLFLHRPLKDLLKEIKPEIKRMTANPKGNGEGYIILRFLDNESYAQFRAQNKVPTGIVVYIKEDFQWDPKARDSAGFAWLQSDFERYGNLTIMGLRILIEK